MSAVRKAVVVGTLRKSQMKEQLVKGKRLDGRDLLQQRNLSIELGVIEKASGSARVRLGDTEIVAGAKVETGRPFPDTPDQGLLIVTAEVLPIASAYAEPGPPNEEAIELARVSDRGIRESGMLDFSKLMIKKGEHVYSVFVDVAVLNDDGGLFDAASYAIVSALSTAKRPNTDLAEDGSLIVSDETSDLDVKTLPIATTFAKIHGKIVFDPNTEEQAMMEARLTLVTDSEGKFVAGQKGGSGVFTFDEMKELARISAERGIEIRKAVRDTIDNGSQKT
ncbi:MAG: exosome complex protein Rrp42 [Nitrososphaerales archaeon]